jgi:hypothetical protein
MQVLAKTAGSRSINREGRVSRATATGEQRSRPRGPRRQPTCWTGKQGSPPWSNRCHSNAYNRRSHETSTHPTCSWRAGCGGSRTSGSAGGGEETAGGTASKAAPPTQPRPSRRAGVDGGALLSARSRDVGGRRRDARAVVEAGQRGGGMRLPARGRGQPLATAPVDGTFSRRANSSNASRVRQVSTYVWRAQTSDRRSNRRPDADAYAG